MNDTVPNTNVLVSVRFTVDVPHDMLKTLVGRPDDGSEEWSIDSTDAAEEWVRDDVIGALDYAINEPDVEAS